MPAKYASLPTFKRILTRIGSEDCSHVDSSSYMVEMQEISSILSNVKQDTLVIVDELGRGTSTQSGLGMAWSVCEYLQLSKAFSFFSTHYAELLKLINIYPSVKSFQLKIDPQNSSSIFLYNLEQGSYKLFCYTI